MAVFEYTAQSNNIEGEGDVETGRIIARDKIEAYDKLRRHDMKLLRLKKLEGISAFFAGRKADIK